MKDVKVPCTKCRYNNGVLLSNSIMCNYFMIWGDKTNPSIMRENKIENGMEIVPITAFNENTCAACDVNKI